MRRRGFACGGPPLGGGSEHAQCRHRRAVRPCGAGDRDRRRRTGRRDDRRSRRRGRRTSRRRRWCRGERRRGADVDGGDGVGMIPPVDDGVGTVDDAPEVPPTTVVGGADVGTVSPGIVVDASSGGAGDVAGALPEAPSEPTVMSAPTSTVSPGAGASAASRGSLLRGSSRKPPSLALAAPRTTAAWPVGQHGCLGRAPGRRRAAARPMRAARGSATSDACSGRGTCGRAPGRTASRRRRRAPRAPRRPTWLAVDSCGSTSSRRTSRRSRRHVRRARCPRRRARRDSRRRPSARGGGARRAPTRRATPSAARASSRRPPDGDGSAPSPRSVRLARLLSTSIGMRSLPRSWSSAAQRRRSRSPSSSPSRSASRSA